MVGVIAINGTCSTERPERHVAGGSGGLGEARFLGNGPGGTDLSGADRTDAHLVNADLANGTDGTYTTRRPKAHGPSARVPPSCR